MNTLIISHLGLKRDDLHGETIIVTGGGGGIGYEAAHALLWLGANVIIAEINETIGKHAAEVLSEEFDPESICFVRTDVGDEASVRHLYQESVSVYGKVDVVINNATIAVIGMVKDLPIEKWDTSYRVNLRGPVLMARAFLPDMINRKHGTFVCVSSTGTAFLGGYETFKAAQVQLANTLDAELEGTGVIAFSISPGLVTTETATGTINQLAPMMGMSLEEFYNQNKNAMLTPEEAGAGFAASIVFAERFKGMEISSLQALNAANTNYGTKKREKGSKRIDDDKRKQAGELCERVSLTLREQSDDWKRRSLFERQWVIRDFKKTAGMSVEGWLDVLVRMGMCLKEAGDITLPPLSMLAGYYIHLAELAKGYEKNAAKLEENLHHIYSWRDEVVELENLLK